MESRPGGRGRDRYQSEQMPSGIEMLDESALKAAYKCRFKPAEQDGKPVAVWVTYKVVFDLDGSTKVIENPLPAPGPKVVPIEIFPEMIYEETPVYPKEAKDEGLEGVVWVKAFVDTDGAATKAIVGKSSGHKCLDKAALAAARKCKYTSALQNGKPIAVWVTYKVDFYLSEESKKSEQN